MQASANVRHRHPLLNCIGTGADIGIIHYLGSHQVTHLRQRESQDRQLRYKAEHLSYLHDVKKVGCEGMWMAWSIFRQLSEETKVCNNNKLMSTRLSSEWRDALFRISFLGEEVTSLIIYFDGVISNNYWGNGIEWGNSGGTEVFADNGFHFWGPFHMPLAPRPLTVWDICSEEPHWPQRKKTLYFPQSNHF